MGDLRERAFVLEAKCWDYVEEPDSACPHDGEVMCKPCRIDTIERALAEVHAATIEECARVVERGAPTFTPSPFVAKALGDAVRALADGGGRGGGKQ